MPQICIFDQDWFENCKCVKKNVVFVLLKVWQQRCCGHMHRGLSEHMHRGLWFSYILKPPPSAGYESVHTAKAEAYCQNLCLSLIQIPIPGPVTLTALWSHSLSDSTDPPADLTRTTERILPLFNCTKVRCCTHKYEEKLMLLCKSICLCILC